MTPIDRRLWIDLPAARYLDAVEASDFDRQRRVVGPGRDRPELERGASTTFTPGCGRGAGIGGRRRRCRGGGSNPAVAGSGPPGAGR